MTAAGTAIPWLVVLNWNNKADTLALLETLAVEQAHVVVVDNGSDDGSEADIRAQFPAVELIQTGENRGYAGGNNVGIAYALERGAQVIGVLNNDTLVDAGFLEPLLAELQAADHAAVSPDIRYADEPDVAWFRGSFIDTRKGWPQHLAPASQPVGEATFESPVLTGCCILASAATWRRVGLFDEGMFLMFEDSDWSRRAVDAGVDLLVVPRARIRHKVSRSFTGEAGVLGSYYFARNGTVFAWRHLGAVQTARFVVRQVLRTALRELFDAQRRPFGLMACLGLLAAVSRRRGKAGRVATALARHALIVKRPAR